MCNYFSCIVFKSGEIAFTEEDSHSTIMYRLDLDDTDAYLREFVRIELVPPFELEDFKVDENGSAPGWFEEERFLWIDRVTEVAKRVDAVKKRFDEETDVLRDEYKQKCDAYVERRQRANRRLSSIVTRRRQEAEHLPEEERLHKNYLTDHFERRWDQIIWNTYWELENVISGVFFDGYDQCQVTRDQRLSAIPGYVPNSHPEEIPL